MDELAIFKHERSSIGAFLLDATLREVHTAESEVTENPVEKGAAVSDHSRPKPVRITIDGLVTASPLQPDPSRLQPSEVYQELIRAKDAGDLLTVKTKLATYDDMVIESISVTRDAGTGDALPFTATLKQIRVVATVSVDRPVERVKKPRAKQTVALEEKPKVEEPNKRAPKTRPKSLATKQTDWLSDVWRGAFG
jgi:hypothetical protein